MLRDAPYQSLVAFLWVLLGFVAPATYALPGSTTCQPFVFYKFDADASQPSEHSLSGDCVFRVLWSPGCSNEQKIQHTYPTKASSVNFSRFTNSLNPDPVF